MLEIDISEVDTALSKLETIDKRFDIFAQAVYENAVDKVNREHNIDTNLRNSLYINHVSDGYILGADSSLAPYARFVHNGTGPHEIKPKNKKTLRFVGKDGHFWQFWGPKTKQEQAKILAWKKKKGINDRFVFKWVHHPGYKGDPFFLDAIDEELPQGMNKIWRWIDDL